MKDRCRESDEEESDGMVHRYKENNLTREERGLSVNPQDRRLQKMNVRCANHLL